MNQKSLQQMLGVGLVLLFLVGCGGGATPTSALPKIGVPLSAGDSLTVMVIEYTTLPEVPFLDETAMRQPSPGNTYQAVAIEMKLASGTYTTMLNLDKVIVITQDGKNISPFTLTLGPGPDSKISDLAFYKSIGEDGKTLDFGLGFSGMDLTRTDFYSQGKVVALQKYHGGNPVWLTFLFEVPEVSKVEMFQFNDLPQVSLTQ